MRVALASDHAGLRLKQQLLKELAGEAELFDLGTDSEEPVDYPDIAARLSDFVRAGDAERGILICGSGAGASIAANKIGGIRAALAHDVYTAHQAVEHDDANIIVFGARVIAPPLALDLARTFLAASYTGAERHVRRLAKITALEARESRDR
ncbi:MAG: RpiB/LacA/LacB family sugar-phosphate isomerase [Gaiellaceae bacterium]